MVKKIWLGNPKLNGTWKRSLTQIKINKDKLNSLPADGIWTSDSWTTSQWGIRLNDNSKMENWDLKVVGSVVFLGIFCTGLAYLPYFILIKRVGPISTSLVALLVPIFGMLWAYLLLKETITLTMLGGCLLIIMGVLLTNLSGNGSSKNLNKNLDNL